MALNSEQIELCSRAAAGLFSNSDPICAVLAQAGLQTIRQQGTGHAAEVIEKLGSISAAAQGAALQEDLHRMLLAPESRQLGVDRVLSVELAKGRVYLAAGQYRQFLSGSHFGSTLSRDTVLNLLADVRAQGDAHIQNTLLHVAGAASRVLGADGLASLPSLIGPGSRAEQAIAQLTRVFDGFPADWTDLAKNLDGWAAEEAGRSLEGLLKEGAMTTRFFDDAGHARTAPDLPGWSPSVQGLSSAAGALQAVLAATGQGQAAAELSRAIAVAQSAVQIYDAGQLLLAATTGWGGCLAVAGLASSLGGMSAFGGIGNNGPAHQELMDMVQQLVGVVQREFRAVNRKLDTMLDSLSKLAAELRETRLEVQLVAARVRQIEYEVRGLVWVVNRGIFTLSNQAMKDQIGPCATKLEDQLVFDRLGMASCKRVFAELGRDSHVEPPQAKADAGGTSDETLNAAASLLEAMIMGGEYGTEGWACQSLVSQLLAGDAGFIFSGPHRFEPWLLKAIESFSELRRANPELFDSLNDAVTKEQLAWLRSALAEHVLALSALRRRGDSTIDPQDPASWNATSALPRLYKAVRACTDEGQKSIDHFASGVARHLLKVLLKEYPDKNKPDTSDPLAFFPDLTFISITFANQFDIITTKLGWDRLPPVCRRSVDAAALEVKVIAGQVVRTVIF